MFGGSPHCLVHSVADQFLEFVVSPTDSTVVGELRTRAWNVFIPINVYRATSGHQPSMSLDTHIGNVIKIVF